MSLINKMLKDLEKRGDDTPQNDGEVFVLTDIGAKKSKLKTSVILICIMALVVLFTFFFKANKYINKQVKNVETILPATHVSIPVKLQPKTKAKAVVVIKEQKVTLEGVNFVRKNAGNATLNFMLSEVTPLYSIAHSDNGRTLFVTFAHASLGQLDQIAKNSFIDSVNIEKISDSVVKVAIKLRSNVAVKGLDMLSNPIPSLEVVLERDVPKSAENSSETLNDSGKLYKKDLPVNSEAVAKMQYQDALDSLDSSNVDDAIAKMQDVVSQYPGYIEARVGLATLLIKNGHAGNALMVLNSGLKLRSDYIPFIELKARALAEQNKSEAAIKVLEAQTPDINSFQDYYALLGALYQGNGNYLAAAEVYDRLVKLRGVKAEWWVGLGAALEGLGKRNAAQMAYTKALKSYDLSPELRSYVESRM